MAIELGKLGIWRYHANVDPKFAADAEKLGYGTIWLGGSPGGDLTAVDDLLAATDSLGSVRAGRLADLVVLDANPLEDIRNTMRIFAVVANGRLIDAAERERLLRVAQEEAARAGVSPPARQDD